MKKWKVWKTKSKRSLDMDPEEFHGQKTLGVKFLVTEDQHLLEFWAELKACWYLVWQAGTEKTVGHKLWLSNIT